MMDIHSNVIVYIHVAVVVNSHLSRIITMSLMNQVTSFAESTDAV